MAQPSLYRSEGKTGKVLYGVSADEREQVSDACTKSRAELARGCKRKYEIARMPDQVV
jgi:hypothetical protein